MPGPNNHDLSKKINQPFIHPGMMQDRRSPELMKHKALSGEESWLNAFNNLKK
jgi:hypothetical protein